MSAGRLPLAPPGTIWIPSQRGSTCGTDVLFTILEFSSVLENCYNAHLNEPKVQHVLDNIAPKGSKPITAKYALYLSFGRSINRYKQLAALSVPKGRVPLIRANSNAEGLGRATLETLSSARNVNVEGSYCEDLVWTARTILENNSVGFLPKALNEKIKIYERPDSINPSKIFGIIFLLEFRGVGHFVGFLYRNGEWYFSDNEVGVLHHISDKDFVDTLLSCYNNAGGSKNICFAESDKNKSKDLNYRIMLINKGKQYEYLNKTNDFPAKYSTPSSSIFFELNGMKFDKAASHCASHKPFGAVTGGVVAAGAAAAGAAAAGAATGGAAAHPAPSSRTHHAHPAPSSRTHHAPPAPSSRTYLAPPAPGSHTIPSHGDYYVNAEVAPGFYQRMLLSQAIAMKLSYVSVPDPYTPPTYGGGRTRKHRRSTTRRHK